MVNGRNLFKIKLKVFGRIIGMTITELLVVVVIIGLLSAMALPMFTKTLENAKFAEAIDNLNLIAAGERFYWKERGNYTNIITELNIENPNNPSAYFTYDTEGTDPLGDDFEAKAVRKGTGPYGGAEYKIQKDGQISQISGPPLL